MSFWVMFTFREDLQNSSSTDQQASDIIQNLVENKIQLADQYHRRINILGSKNSKITAFSADTEKDVLLFFVATNIPTSTYSLNNEYVVFVEFSAKFDLIDALTKQKGATIEKTIELKTALQSIKNVYISHRALQANIHSHHFPSNQGNHFINYSRYSFNKKEIKNHHTLPSKEMTSLLTLEGGNTKDEFWMAFCLKRDLHHPLSLPKQAYQVLEKVIEGNIIYSQFDQTNSNHFIFLIPPKDENIHAAFGKTDEKAAYWLTYCPRDRKDSHLVFVSFSQIYDLENLNALIKQGDKTEIKKVFESANHIYISKQITDVYERMPSLPSNEQKGITFSKHSVSDLEEKKVSGEIKNFTAIWSGSNSPTSAKEETKEEGKTSQLGRKS